MTVHARCSADDSRLDEELGLTPEGGLVPFPTEAWLLGFVPALNDQWWHRFVHPQHCHVFGLRQLALDRWLVLEPWWARTPITVLPYSGARRFLRWAAMGDMLAVREESPGRSSQLRGMMTCAALLTHMLGRPYQILTPHALYRRLLAEPETQIVDPRDLISLLDGKVRAEIKAGTAVYDVTPSVHETNGGLVVERC
ncbi:MAG TPA: hypothetical protein VGN75_00415 [Kaistia sp.]|jgi:hypothetical protein|nr:hypothetical protein [Kaistia sp.]